MTKTYVEFICDICERSSFQGEAVYVGDLTPINVNYKEALPKGWILFRRESKCLCKECAGDVGRQLDKQIEESKRI